MRTVSGSFTGFDYDFRFDGLAEPRRIDRRSSDAWVSYLMNLPRGFPPLEEGQVPPGIELEGRSGMWLRLVRSEPGEILRLSMKDGEQDFRLSEMQAVERVRLFVRHWGDDTELTSEIRLPTDERERILAGEVAKDALRRESLTDSPPVRTFRRKRSRLLPFTAVELVVDREKLAVFEKRRGELVQILDLRDVREADVRGFAEGKPDGWHFRAVAVAGGECREVTLGGAGWPMETAIRIAECVNDALDISESRRKLLAYRREQAKGAAGR